MRTTLEQTMPYVGDNETLEDHIQRLTESLASWATCIARDAMAGDPEPLGRYYLEHIVDEVSDMDRFRAERRRRRAGFWLARPESPYAQSRVVVA